MSLGMTFVYLVCGTVAFFGLACAFFILAVCIGAIMGLKKHGVKSDSVKAEKSAEVVSDKKRYFSDTDITGSGLKIYRG